MTIAACCADVTTDRSTTALRWRRSFPGSARGAAAAFDTLRGRARFWHWPQHQRPVMGRSRAALHAKLIAADRQVALLGSANLTDRALAFNIEIGVVLREPDAVRRIVGHFRGLMDAENGPLRRLPDYPALG